jgi:hypothetical protein
MTINSSLSAWSNVTSVDRDGMGKSKVCKVVMLVVRVGRIERGDRLTPSTPISPSQNPKPRLVLLRRLALGTKNPSTIQLSSFPRKPARIALGKENAPNTWVLTVHLIRPPQDASLNGISLACQNAPHAAYAITRHFEAVRSG